MSKTLDELAARKQLLIARSTLTRLQIQSELLGLRDSVSWTRIGLRAATSAPVRSAMFGLALSRLGHNRMARLLGLASKVILAAKMTGVAVAIRKQLKDEAGSSAQP
jgi:hypothetical protein